MDLEKARRRPLRARIMVLIGEAAAEMAKEEPDHDVLIMQHNLLEETMTKLKTIDESIQELMLHDLRTEEDEDAEFQEAGDYEKRVQLVKIRINRILYPRASSPSPSQASFARQSEHGSGSGSSQKRSFRLPKIELKTFDGNLKEWLGFWSQFEKIHEDETLHATDKFQYLVQAMVPGTEPSELVRSFPQSAANYPKAIEALKRRFGREPLLIQVYVRELLVLAFHNVANKEKIPLAKMFMKLKSHLRALDSLNLATADPSTWLFPLVESSLPVETLRAWQRSPLSQKDGSAESPPKTVLDFLMEFLEMEVESDQRIELASNGFRDFNLDEKKNWSGGGGKQKQQKDKSDVPTAAGLFSGQSGSCIFCEKPHASAECFGAKKMSMQEKKDKIAATRACFTCLKIGHSAKKCKAYVSCWICSKKHQTVMCPESGQKTEFRSQATPTTQNNLCSTGEVLLPTLLAALVHNGKRKVVRVLCDTGAQHSYIKRGTAKELSLTPTGKVQYRHSIFGKRDYVEDHERFVVELERLGPGASGGAKFEVLCQEEICGDIPRMPRGPWIKELKSRKIWLSDMGQTTGSEIEILVGAKDYADILTGNSHRLKNGLVAIETRLGWTMFGKEKELGGSTVKTLVALHVGSGSVEDSVSRLWDLDVIGIMDPVEHKTRQEVEEETRQHFLNSVTRTEDGRYCVMLPWIDGAPALPDNRVIAERRLVSSSRKLQEKGQFEVYDAVFQSWLQEGIIERVEPGTTGGHFIPHRPVFKPGSTTTPVRPVYDAGCKIKGKPSLNDCLRKGPNLLEEIPAILLRFRENKIGVISDIRKAFLMVGVAEPDRNSLKFLWWETAEQEKIVEFRHRRVVFGVNCSPFLLAAVLEYHLKNLTEEDRGIGLKLLKSMYVDNCVTSVSSAEEYEEFRETSTRVLAEAKMELRCWEHGSLENTGVDISSERENEDQQSVTSVLGLRWDKKRDTLSIDLTQPEIPEKITKRSILSAVHRVFDPIGGTAPVLLLPKLMLQEVWAQEVTWDEEVSMDIAKKFKSWANELVLLRRVRIPRHVNPFNAEKEGLSIHTFCDASKDAYAAVIFMRAESSSGVSVRLIQAKSRVAPLKRIKDKEGVKTERRLTIPRLELLAATIGARLTHVTKEAMDWDGIPTHFWSDSTTAIAWIQRDEDWGTFVGNRVREVMKLTKSEDWSHVPGKANPADLPSRGCSAAQFLCSKWWEGPDWLYKDKEDWPVSSKEDVDEEEVARERRKTTRVMTVSSKPSVFVPTFSSYKKNVNVMGWVLRFIGNLKKSEAERVLSRFLTVNEVRVAEREVLKIVQREGFPNGVQDITPIKVTEEEGLLRVKSKLTFRTDSSEFRSPVILPKNHPLVNQLIRYVHETTCHGGTQVVIGALREKYWILQVRRAVSEVIRGCTRCRRYSVKNLTVEPAALPSHRVQAEEVFQNSGVDLAGPLFLADGSKCWIVLFTCAVYRAVHLDLVTSLSTEAFMGSLERFINSNGRPDVMYSDNGTNFVGAANLFRKIDWKKVEEACQVKEIKWVFNPPTAAWWGGWWERLIRTVKDLLRKMLGRAKLTYDELRTCISGVEATVNSRPLTTVTEDVEDLIPLTPMMFTRTLLLPKFPEVEKISSQELQKRFRKIQDLKKDLQARFRKEYLGLLVQKTAERKCKPPEVGDVVLVGSDDRKRFEWPLGRILELLPGRDSNVRTAKVLIMMKQSEKKRSSTEIKTRIVTRPLQRLYPLEVRKTEVGPQFVGHEKAEKGKTKIPANEEDQEKLVITRSGRKVTRPRRYGQWNM